MLKILIPVDGSAHSNAALDFVASRTTLLGGGPRIQLVNVQPALSPRITRAIGSAQAREYQHEQARRVLRPALARLAKAGVAAQASVAIGRRADTVAALAVRQRADLIVMGSRGQSPLKGLVLGSTTNAVLAGCTKPLLVLRERRAPRSDSLSVGIAIDGSRYGLAAVRWALAHRELFGAAPGFELIHVTPGVVPTPGPLPAPVLPLDAAPPGAKAVHRAASDKVIEPARRAFARKGIEPAITLLRHHNPGDAIVAHARRRRLDLLVLGSHGYGAMKSLVLGSVALRVASTCATPLLLIREP